MRLISCTCVMVLIIGFSLILTLQAIATADQDQTLVLTSSAFENGGRIPGRYSCSGHNESPVLKWTGIPDGTRSLALILDDPDAPMGTFVHWVVYNVSPTTTGLPEGVSASASFAEQGVNGSGAVGYTGPCPPPGKAHHYHFRLYALDQKLDLKAGATARQLEAAIKGHVVGSTELVGTFER